ncbi:MAG TPA: biopolymer transporter ExbD [Bryobacteraceae bacterium]|nr:biopolymer transporter ExbD [Bryobacteraceae bacterium]
MEKKKAPHVVNDINVTPMVDVMLVLLIIFMVITPMLNKGQTVEKVVTKNAIAMQAADKEDAILVAVTKDGQFWLSPGNNLIKDKDLAGKVRDLQTNKMDKTVYIKADARAKYEAVEDVVDILRSAGVDQIGLLTEQRNEEKAERPRAAAPVVP